MIGTILRLGFDATAIQRGLAGLGGLFGRATRQIGIGGLRQVGAQMTDWVGRIATMLPQAGKEMMDWAGNLTDMSAQTGVSIQKLILMEEALRMTGASAADTSRMMSTFADNLFEATKGSEAQKKALNDLGFYVDEIGNMPLDEAFLAIGAAVSKLPKDFKGLEGIMADLFGARMGYKMIRFFKDFDGSMKIAQKNVASFTDISDKAFSDFDNISDIMGRWAMTRRSLMSGIIEGVAGSQGLSGLAGDIDKIFDNAGGPGARKFMKKIGSELSDTFFEGLAIIESRGISGYLGGLLQGIGKKLGEGIMEAVKGSFGGGGDDWKSKVIKAAGGALFSSNSGGGDLFKETTKQTTILSRIERKGITATYA